MIYLAIYIIIGIIAVVEQVVKKSQRKYLLFFAAIIIVSFQSLRWKTGTDWPPYYDFFISSENWSSCADYGFEIGYSILNYLVRNITDSYTVFLIIECTLNCIFICLYAKYFGNGKYTTILLVTSFALMVFPIRFTLASNIIVYSYKYIIEKKPLQFGLLFLLAFSIHRSVIAFIPTYFIVRKHYSIYLILSVYFISIILGVLTEYTFGNVLQIISGFYGNLGDTYQDKLDAYVTGGTPDAAQMSLSRIILSFINSTVFILGFYYFKKKYFPSDIKYNILFNLYVIGICFNRIFLQIIPDFTRITSLYAGGFAVMLIMIVSQLRRLSNRLILCILILIYYFYNYWSYIDGYYSYLFFPYYSIFSDTQRMIS